MGFTVKRTIFKLAFEDLKYAGMEVSVRSISIGAAMDVADQAEALKRGAGLSVARDLIKVFTANITSWNLTTEEGEDMPPTGEVFLGLEPELATDILLAWYDAQMGVSRPLDERSTSGSTPPEVSLPMEIS